MKSKLAGLLLGVACVGLALALQNWEPAGANEGPRTARRVRPDRPARPASAPAAPTAEQVAEQAIAKLREENRILRGRIEQLEDEVTELVSGSEALETSVAVEEEPRQPVEPPAAADEAPPKPAVRTRRADRGERPARTIIHIHRHEPCPDCAAAQAKVEDIRKQLEQAQREAKEAAAQHQAAVKQRDELAESLKTAQQERDLAVLDAEAAARSRDEAQRSVEYSKKERDEAMRAADAAIKQAKQAAQDRDTAVNAAQAVAKEAVEEATRERDQARRQANAATLERDTARQISQDMQRQRLAAYDEATAARAEVAPARLAQREAQRRAAELGQLSELYRSGEHEWAQFAVQLAEAVGVTDLLPPQEARWSSHADATQAWLDKVRQRYARLLAQNAPPSEADAAGASFSYAEGLRHMQEQNYAAAVRRFSEAIDRYPSDARYYYLRGLARHLATKGSDLADAEHDVRHAAELEKQSSPSSRTVDQALERFQGPSRLWAEKFRR